MQNQKGCQRSIPATQTTLERSSTLPPFESNFHNSLSTDATTKWNNLHNATYKAALEAYGRRVRNNANWYEANLNVMKPLIAAKRSALIQYKKDQIEKIWFPCKNQEGNVNSWQGAVQINTG